MTATLPRAQEPAGPPLGRNNSFDALRLLAALSVVVQHAVIHLHGSFLWYTPGNGWWFPDGVAVFFILSGSMVYASADRCRRDGRPIRDYALNRLLRIAPAIHAYLAVMVVVLLALRVITPGQLLDPGVLLWVASGALLAPIYHPAVFGHFGTGYVNGSLWTIPVEVSFYVLVPVLVWSATRFGFRCMIVAASAASVAGVVVFAGLGGEHADQVDPKVVVAKFGAWLGYFVAGIAITRVWRRLPQHRLVAVAALGVHLGLWVWRRAVDPETSMVIAVVGAVVPLAYLTFWVGHHAPAVVRKVTDRVGDLSFGTYIWHMPVVNVAIWCGFADRPTRAPLVVAVVAVTLGLAFVSWRLVEKPALGLKRDTSTAPDPR